jgi:hypothetical protein
MRFFSRALPIVALACALAAAYNVFAATPEVAALARQAACAGRTGKCTPRLARLARSPFAQSFSFDLGGGLRGIEVECARSWILFGSYACSRR